MKLALVVIDAWSLGRIQVLRCFKEFIVPMTSPIKNFVGSSI